MSNSAAFRRVPVQPQVQQKLQATVIPAPNRGIIQNENYTYMQPGGALVCDNWIPTMRGVKLRGGCELWCQLPESTEVYSGFEYVSGTTKLMFAATLTKVYDVTEAGAPVLAVSGQTSGYFSAAPFSNQGGDWLMAVNQDGNVPIRFDGTAWTKLNSGELTAPPGHPSWDYTGLVYVWTYRNRLFFIEKNSMNAWYLPLNSVQGQLNLIPLGGAATKGGVLVWGATWSIDAGDGTDDKCVFYTSEGEAIIFSGGDPSDPNDWRQEGRYSVSKPMGANAHLPIGGDIIIATVDGLIPLSQAITKTADQLELAALSRTIKPMWREMALSRNVYQWQMKKWDEYGAVFVTWPGGSPGSEYVGCANSATGAWGRIVGWDALCWIYNRGRMFFGTTDGKILQAMRTGYDNGMPYTATLVGGWEMFQSPPQEVVWHEARAAFTTVSGQPFQPQLAACTDYVLRVPSPPIAGPDPGVPDVWDQGLWDGALWDQAATLFAPVIRNTMWVSIGETGFSHAPICQVTVAQQALPNVELVSIAATFERLGVNV